MSDEHEHDYLWDASGPPDPDVQSLERALGELRYSGELDALPAQPAQGGWRVSLLVAAGVLAVAGAALVFDARPPLPLPPPSAPHWAVDSLAGRPVIGDDAIGASGHLALGQWLVTDEASKARIAVADIGLVDVFPDSQVRLVGTRASEHRLELRRGRLEATVTAPPRLFVVETPAATAVDLGCKYSLDVDADGAGLLEVRMGFVSLEAEGRVSIVPRGARCATQPGVGPGTPYAVDALPRLRDALTALDFGAGGPEHLDQVLNYARAEDALTLWHLLSRVGDAERAKVYDRLALLEPAPEGVTREGMLRLDATMLEAWRLRLGLGW